jgi:NitT/TauT family transport system substrate-binding protein
MFQSLRRIWRYAALFLITAAFCFACSTKTAQTNASKPLIVGNSPWPGFVAQYVAEVKGFYQQEGITVQEEFFQVSTDTNTALMADKLDVAWTATPDIVVMAKDDPSLRVIAISDYSDGADGILAKGVEKPADLVGKSIAWEELPLQTLLLTRYLEGSNVTLDQLDLKVMPAAEAATAFASGRTDVAITFEPWLTTAEKDGTGKIAYSSKGTNLIASALVGKADALEARKDDILAYFRALEKGMAFYESNPEEAIAIVAKKLNSKPEEVAAMLTKVKMFKPSEQQSIVFNTKDPLNIIDSLKFAAQVGKDRKFVDPAVDASTLYDASYTQSL